MIANLDARFAAHVANLKKPPHELVADAFTRDLVHMAMGISGESGELLEHVKKIYAYNKAVDREAITKELGDLEFYLEGFRQTLNISREDILIANIEKLSCRYKNGYSDEAAIARIDTEGA